jgi:hypothetical protein
MKTQWVKGLEEDAVKEMELHFNGSAQLRKRLKALIEDKIDAKERKGLGESEYECPNWAFKQADAQGYKRALFEIISLIS